MQSIPEEVDPRLYKNVLTRGGQAYGEIERALPMIRDYIRKKRLILYGGMAVDFALKAAGREGIYPPDEVPDYDVMSPNFYEDSNEIADMLFAAGMQSAQAINAMHITSRRVRIQFEAVADLTYIPQEIYDNLPTLEYEGFRVIHPDWQRLDMHRAFCFMLEKPPGEVIKQRLHKDIKRFPMLAAAYPISRERMQKTTLGAKRARARAKDGGGEGGGVMRIPREWLKRGALGGWAALAIYACAAGEAGAKCEIDGEELRVEMKGWRQPPIHLLSDDYEWYEQLGECTYYSRFLDNFYPRMVAIAAKRQTLELADNLGMLLPVVDMGELPGMEAARGILLTSGHHVLLYMLLRAFSPPIAELHAVPAGERSTLYLDAYEHMCRLMIGGTAGPPAYLRLSLQTYGGANLSPDYLAAMALKLDKNYVKGVDLSRAPGGYYVDKGRAPESFQVGGQELFLVDGRRRERFLPLVPQCWGEETQKKEQPATEARSTGDG